MAELTIRAHAKINLDLRLGSRRPDGFHPIDTLFVKTDIADRLSAVSSPDGSLNLSIDGDEKLSAGPDNLILRAAGALREKTKTAAGAKLRLHKEIPQGAGLGGGSSDAAATLRLLQQLWSLKVTDPVLMEIAAELGSDVPFFLQPDPARGTGRGEILEPLPIQTLPWAVLIHPGFGSPTAEAYRRYAAHRRPGEEGHPLSLPLKTGKSLEVRPRNDLEPAVEEKFLWIRAARHWLSEQPGVLAARMSGSGSTVFGLWASEKEAKSVADKAKGYFGPHSWIRSTRLLGAGEKN
ncbi:MAG: 4-(cytidine 5'-diphospho)-2-C-methyl-D-erythritol kinase [Verrucomicrobia bacterium]|nr:4-(cytidine 5'-diphospho)-2-C-methyl-D-erythritol kinase [Verrucomicrobiota bacterium]